MKRQHNPVRIVIIFIGVIALIAVASAVSLFADVQRIGCESGAQLIGPASSDGYSVSNPSKPGACFVSFVSLRNKTNHIDRVTCGEEATFASCQGFRQQVSSGWSTFFGTRCTSISFIGGASCACTETGEGCQSGQWDVEIQP